MKNNRWKREAKRIYGECHKMLDCTECKYSDECIEKMRWLGKDLGIKELERRCKQ